MSSPAAAGVFAAASTYLARRQLRCPEHKVAHTGKLARSIVLDLALLDATGSQTYRQRVVDRARYVASQLAPDPEHGALIYLPGRLDPRNCSTSAIDSGECTDALARLLGSPHAASLDAADRALVEHAVERNAETYLRTACVEKEISNQRLWAAMGLASAYRLHRRPDWAKAIYASIQRSLAEQRSDGSWGYQLSASTDGAHAGAADLTVYYHSRCLAFLLHIVDCLPELAGRDDVESGLKRGLAFLAGVITPDGLKPLALEAKRWFWDGSYEAGSNAYDVYALIRGVQRFDRPGWLALAARCWQRLKSHQDPDGGVTACRDNAAADFVCRDFHTADLAWPAQLLAELPDAGVVSPALSHPALDQKLFSPSGVGRLERGPSVALLRTAKLPRNTQFGGAIGGGTIAYAGSTARPENRIHTARESSLVEASFTLFPAQPRLLAALRRFFRDNPPNREGRQWLFVARLLLAQGRPQAACGRLWRGLLAPLAWTLRDPIGAHWSSSSELKSLDEGVLIRCQPARPDGTVPAWAASVTAERRYRLSPTHLEVEDSLILSPHNLRAHAVYLLPAAAERVVIQPAEPAVRRAVRGRELRFALLPGRLCVSFRLALV